jgi:aspartate beta-hydroxylase
MPSSTVSAQELSKTGMHALQNGDARTARLAFEKIVATRQADASVFLALAYACRNLQDGAAALDAINQVLMHEPGNLRALIFKADCLHEAGDARGASSFYRTALRVAAASGELPPDVRQEMVRAQSMCDRYAAQFGNYLTERLAAHGLTDAPSTRRFRQSLDMLTGIKTRYVQEPLYYFFPELPQIQFFERSEFPWLEKLEAQTPSIRAELIEVMKKDSAFEPYVQADPNRPHNPQSGMLNNPDWSAFYLWKNGEVVAENAGRCPNTMAALADVPLAAGNNRSPSILFSLLRPGAHIPAHTGFVNTRLICHLPLIVPEGCRFRVGNEVRSWEQGKAWVFDDTMEHEAWNGSKETRVILLFEIWRPELSMEERGLVSAMFDAIDAHSGEKPEWNI